jgi:hypothetical protein
MSTCTPGVSALRAWIACGVTSLDRQLGVHHRGGTKPGTLLKQQIPVRTYADWDDKRIGSDNGAEFINGELLHYALEEKLTFTRGRVARKTPLAQGIRRTEELVGGASNGRL